MLRKQGGFSVVEVLLVLVLAAVIVFTGWYVLHSKRQADNLSGSSSKQQTSTPPSRNPRFYQITGTQQYLCTKSLPAQCRGEIKIEDINKKTRLVKVDNKTNFNGADPASLYASSEAKPLNASIKISSGQAQNIKLLTDAEATDECVNEVYALHPESRPENRKPDGIYLAPPCPGVPQ